MTPLAEEVAREKVRWVRWILWIMLAALLISVLYASPVLIYLIRFRLEWGVWPT